MNTKNTGQIEVANSQDIYGAVSPVLAEPSRLQMATMERLLISQSGPSCLEMDCKQKKNQTKYYDSCKNKLSHSISPTLVSYENK